MADERDAAYMRRALELARRGRIGTHPNPMVGAVLVRDGRVIGEGWHRRYGGPHAEVEALESAGEAARGATMYVTLEPCAHHGRTPPCTDALIAAGVARVVVAVADPNPIAGGGMLRLRAAGVHVARGVEEAAARSLNAAFLHIHERGAPFIALKLALSLDGRIAAGAGMRTAITGRSALAETHRLRAAHDAVLIGSGTARIDDPLLTVRDPGAVRQPVRIVLDSAARLPLTSRLVATVEASPVWVLCSDTAPAERVQRLSDAGVRVIPLASDAAGRVELRALPPLLAHEQLAAVLVEGGAVLASALLDAGLVHRLYLFIAPHLLPGGVPGLALSAAAQPAWSFAGMERCGEDILLTLDPAAAPAEHH